MYRNTTVGKARRIHKRSLGRCWGSNELNSFAGTLFIPRFGNERILNESASMRFIADRTNIPLPKLCGCFEDDGAVYLVIMYVEGVTMNSLTGEQCKVAEKELERYMGTLMGLGSELWGGPSGTVSLLLTLSFLTTEADTQHIGFAILPNHSQLRPPTVEDET